MASEWREVTIGEFAPFSYGKGLPERHRNDSGRVPVYGSNGIVGFHSEALTSGPTVIIGRKGTVGAVHYSHVPCWPIDTTFYVIDDDPQILRFKYYLLKSVGLDRMNADSAVPGLNREAAHGRKVHIPPLPEQRAIAHILGTLDDKIELNLRMSETLEQMTRALFKAWFVDFEPVRAKMEGRWRRGESLPGLPAYLYDLFPDRLVPSELGEIPEEWEVTTLGQHFDVDRGVSYNGRELGSDGIPLHNLNSIYEGGGYKYDSIKYYRGKFTDRHTVMPGDVIVANTEQGHDRLLIGYAALVPSVFGEMGVISHHIYRVRPRPGSPLTSLFICHLLNSPDMHNVVSGYATGTTVNMLPVDGLQKPLFVLPPADLVAVFDNLAHALHARHEVLMRESRTLAALRDALLPKLIRGEVRVKCAERFLEARGL